ncbi:MAG: hypothetical protein JNK15_11105 [Planctomycetes bacterium]|nr:hypothetical protein [Planctomycetota bacterium]
MVAECVVPGHGRLRVPASGDEVLVCTLTCSPAATGESFVHGERCLHFTPGSTVTLRTKLRVYGTAGKPPRPLGEVLDHAFIVRDGSGPTDPPPEAP